jgi:hypothetical protein
MRTTQQNWEKNLGFTPSKSEREREREEKENQSVLVRESKRVVSSLSRLCLTLFPYFDIGCVVVMPDSEMTLSHVSMSRFEEYGIVPNYNVPLSDVADSISTHLTWCIGFRCIGVSTPRH